MSQGIQGSGQPERATRRVFISSTSVDLGDYRARVADLVAHMGQFAVVMDRFPVRPTGSADATSLSLDELGGCRIYILLVAWRYGHVPGEQALSVTHQEYREARRLKLTSFVFLAADSTDADTSDDALFPAAVRDPEHRRQLDDFRAELRQHPVDFFTSAGDLVSKVAGALHAYLLGERSRERGVPYDLPPRAPQFVGRETERRALAQALRRGQSVGLSAAVAGMAGVGKSALAAEVVHDLAIPPAGESDPFPGGITWVRCDGRSGLDGLGWVYDQLLAAWDATLPPDAPARAGTPETEVELREHALQARLQPPGGEPSSAALVLLDNVELGLPLTRALDTLAPLGIGALVTARHEPAFSRLHLARLDVLDPEAAVRLFSERYAERGGDWDEARDAAAGREVVEALGRLPLAIELAAARAARARGSVAGLAAELRRPDVLDRLRDPLDPTVGVRYAFEKSLALLTPAQRARFAALGLPDGPDWPRPVIEGLLAAVPPSPASALPNASDVAPSAPSVPAASGTADLDLLTALSLVQLVVPSAASAGAADVDGPARVRLHPLLRELARAEWAAQPEATRAAGLAALLAAVRDLATEHRRDFATLAREEELIAGAVRRAAEKHIEPAVLAAAVDNLIDYLNIGGHWRLGLDLLALQLEARRQVGDRAGEGATLNNLGSLARSLGHPEQAHSYYEQALVIRREVGDRRVEGTTLNNLGSLARSLGHPEQAHSYLEQALVIRREVGDRAGEGATLNNLGSLADGLGQKEQAHSYYEQALVIRREVGDQAGEGTTLNNLGTLAYAEGQPQVARTYYEQALVITREVGDRRVEGATLNNLGLLADGLGQKEQAHSYYEQALVIFEEIGAVDRAHIVRKGLAYLEARSARGAQATPPNAPTSVPPAEPARKKRSWWPFGR